MATEEYPNKETIEIIKSGNRFANCFLYFSIALILLVSLLVFSGVVK